MGDLESKSADALMLELLYKYAILMEYQLLDLQFSVRSFVEKMNAAIQALDAAVTAEGKHAQDIFHNLFDPNQEEAHILNDRANARVDELIDELMYTGNIQGMSDELKKITEERITKKAQEDSGKDEVLEREARDEIWSHIAKKMESVTRLEERLRPYVYDLITCLNFEDIQTQRLDHILRAYKMLNEGVLRFLQRKGQVDARAVEEFRKTFLKKVREMYTMEEERKIFDQVFHSQ